VHQQFGLPEGVLIVLPCCCVYACARPQMGTAKGPQKQNFCGPFCYLSIPNASSTFPGAPPNRGYPELTNTIPPATTGPAPSSDPP